MRSNEQPSRAQKVAAIRTLTFRAEDHANARAVLTGAIAAEVHTDGSCEYGGLGKGGWAAVIRAGLTTVEIYGGAMRTTVNRMEIIAAIAALELLPPTCAVRVMTDSQYLRKGIRQWIDTWKSNGWMTVTRTPVKNEDLWRRLDGLRIGRQVTWKWVKGHRGNRRNERADELARRGRYSIEAKAEGEAT
jgi:ribonuclease HI